MKHLCTFRKPFVGHLFQAEEGYIFTCEENVWEFPTSVSLMLHIRDLFKARAYKGKENTFIPLTVHVRREALTLTDMISDKWVTEEGKAYEETGLLMRRILQVFA